MMRRHVWIAGLMGILIATTLLLARPFYSSENTSPPFSAIAEVTIENFSFRPRTFRAAVGTTVTWTNRDGIPHVIVGTGGVFKSKVLDTNEKFSYTFSKPGTFPYFCSIHPKITGQVVVR
jgi:plastocyanin